MKTKLMVGISLVLFFIGLVSVLTAGLVIYELKKDSLQKSPKFTGTFGDLLNNESENIFVLDAQEVAKHNSETDCWMIINGFVYDLTGFLSNHPGGKTSLLPYCGGDGTQGFNTKDKSPAVAHSVFARDLLENYYIGPLGKILASKPLPKPSQISFAAMPSPPPQSQLNLATNSEKVQTATNLVLTVSEVAKHHSLQDCWLIIAGSVYNVTSYIASHPGGVAAIGNTCGSDATVAFQTKGGKGKDHSSNAYELLQNYQIGIVGSVVDVTAPAPTSKVPTTTYVSETATFIPDAVKNKYPGAVVISQKIEDDGRQVIKINYQGRCIKIKTDTKGEIKKEENCDKVSD